MKNQTLEEWVLNIGKTDLGIGIFLTLSYANLEVGSNSSKRKVHWEEEDEELDKILIYSITYLDCIKKGKKEGVLAYKWIPNSVADQMTVVNQANSCPNYFCVKRCARYGCLCLEGKCT